MLGSMTDCAVVGWPYQHTPWGKGAQLGNARSVQTHSSHFELRTAQFLCSMQKVFFSLFFLVNFIARCISSKVQKVSVCSWMYFHLSQQLPGQEMRHTSAPDTPSLATLPLPGVSASILASDSIVCLPVPLLSSKS